MCAVPAGAGLAFTAGSLRYQKRQLMHETHLSLKCTMSDSSLCLVQELVFEGQTAVFRWCSHKTVHTRSVW